MRDTVSSNEASPGSTNEASHSLLPPLVTSEESKGAGTYPNCLMYFVRLVERDEVSTSTPSTNEASPSLLLLLVRLDMFPNCFDTYSSSCATTSIPLCLIHFVRLVGLDEGLRLEPQGGGVRLSGGMEAAAGSMVGHNNS